MMQVPGAFAGVNGAPTSFPHQAATPVDGEGNERHWGPPDPPSVGATTRDEQWTVCRDMIRGGSNGLRAHFTRPTISTCRPPRREQTNRSRQSRAGVAARYRAAISGGIGVDLMFALLAPRNEPDRCGGAVAEHQRWVGVHRSLTGLRRARIECLDTHRPGGR
jgi:hypothetical protein